MKSLRWFEIREEIYDSHTVVVTDCTIEDFRTFLKKRYKAKHVDRLGVSGADGMTCEVNPTETCIPDVPCQHPTYAIWVKDSGNLTVGLHELFHLTIRVSSSHNVPIVAGSDEPAAYLFDFFYRKYAKGIAEDRGGKPTRRTKKVR